MISTLLLDARGTLVTPNFRRMADEFAAMASPSTPNVWRAEALARLDFERPDFVRSHVGDVFKVDVLGARAAGMRAVLIDPHDFHADKPCPRQIADRGFARGVRGSLTRPFPAAAPMLT